MRIQIYMSPKLSKKISEEAQQKGIVPSKLANQLLMEHYGIADDNKTDYKTALASVIDEVEKRMSGMKNEDTFTLLDLDSFKSIGDYSLRAAVGRGFATYCKTQKNIDYLRNIDGEIKRTTDTHAAIYQINK